MLPPHRFDFSTPFEKKDKMRIIGPSSSLIPEPLLRQRREKKKSCHDDEYYSRGKLIILLFILFYFYFYFLFFIFFFCLFVFRFINSFFNLFLFRWNHRSGSICLARRVLCCNTTTCRQPCTRLCGDLCIAYYLRTTFRMLALVVTRRPGSQNKKVFVLFATDSTPNRHHPSTNGFHSKEKRSVEKCVIEKSVILNVQLRLCMKKEEEKNFLSISSPPCKNLK